VQINVGCDVDLATHYNATSVLAPTRKRQVIALGQVDAHISMTLQSAGSSLVGSIGAARSHTASALVPMKGQHASSRHLEVIITLSPVSGCRVRRYVARVPVSFVIRLLARHSDSGFRGAIQRVAHEHPSFRLLVDYEPALALCSTYGRALHRQNSVIGHVLPLLEPALTTEFFGGDIVCLRDTVQDALGARGNAIARSGRNSLIDSGALHGRGSVVPMDNSCGGSAGQRNRAVALRKPPLRETAMMKVSLARLEILARHFRLDDVIWRKANVVLRSAVLGFRYPTGDGPRHRGRILAPQPFTQARSSFDELFSRGRRTSRADKQHCPDIGAPVDWPRRIHD
jgi:hypothetical protein